MRIRNWKKFQHFKDRRPPWIKLHREMLDQRDINLISDCSFRVLVFLWLLAAEDPTMNGELPDIQEICFRLRMDECKITSSLQELKEWIEYSDIDLISSCQQVVPPETETETEVETETKTEKKNLLSDKSNAYSEDFLDFWSWYPKKTGKGAAYKSWKKEKPNIADVTTALSWQIESQQWLSGYIPLPTTYLNQRRWEDEPEPEKQSESNQPRNRSFNQIKTDNTVKAMQDFVGGGDAGNGQKRICDSDG